MMRISKLCSAATFLLSGLLVLVGGNFSLLFAQEKAIGTYSSQIPKEECLNAFDINNIDFEDPKAIKNIPLLAEYFQCRAAIRGDMNECNNLNPWHDQVSLCRKNFNDYQGFYGRLAMVGQATPQILNVCINVLRLNIEECKLYASAWLTGDLSYCERVKRETRKFADCKAMITGDTSSCGGSDSCINKAAYFKAIRTNNINECERIKDSSLKIMCQGYISMDEKTCENNEGFKKFRIRYCE